MIAIEGDTNSVIITILEPKGEGFVGTSSEISKASLINKLIDEGVLDHEEMVRYDEEAAE